MLLRNTPEVFKGKENITSTTYFQVAPGDKGTHTHNDKANVAKY